MKVWSRMKKKNLKKALWLWLWLNLHSSGPPLPVYTMFDFNTIAYPGATSVTASWHGTQERCTTVTKSNWWRSWVTWIPNAMPWRQPSTTSRTSARARTPTVPSRGASLSCSLGNNSTRIVSSWNNKDADNISECVCIRVYLLAGVPITMRTSIWWWWLMDILLLVTKSHVEVCRRLLTKPSYTGSKCSLSPSHLTRRYNAYTHIQIIY